MLSLAAARRSPIDGLLEPLTVTVSSAAPGRVLVLWPDGGALEAIEAR
jgi:hypothetical protein